MKLIVLNAPGFYRPILTGLAAHGIEHVLVTASARKGVLQDLRETLTGAACQSTFDAQCGSVPPGYETCVEAASEELILAMQGAETLALRMIDRLDVDNRGFTALRALYLRYLAVWPGVLRRSGAGAVLFHSAPHMGYDFVVYSLCKLIGMRTLVVDRTMLSNRLLLLDDIYRMPSPDTAECRLFRHTPAADDAFTAPYWDAISQRRNDLPRTRRILSAASLATETLKAPFEGWARVESSAFAVDGGRRPAAMVRLRELGQLRLARTALKVYEAHARLPEPDSKFVYLPLHFEPERTVAPAGRTFIDQLHVAEMLTQALPEGWELVVKEHVSQFTRGLLWSKGRGLPFYESLIGMPRVRLAPLATPSARLISSSEAVATITGTAGWEAVRAGKPALVFGVPWYVNAPGVRRATSVADVAEHLARVQQGEASHDPQEAAAFAAAIVAGHSFPGAFFDRLFDRSGLTIEENAESYLKAILIAIAPENQPMQVLHDARC